MPRSSASVPAVYSEDFSFFSFSPDRQSPGQVSNVYPMVFDSIVLIQSPLYGCMLTTKLNNFINNAITWNVSLHTAQILVLVLISMKGAVIGLWKEWDTTVVCKQMLKYNFYFFISKNTPLTTKNTHSYTWIEKRKVLLNKRAYLRIVIWEKDKIR